jgi:hypothetical protein
MEVPIRNVAIAWISALDGNAGEFFNSSICIVFRRRCPNGPSLVRSRRRTLEFLGRHRHGASHDEQTNRDLGKK